MIAFQFEFNGKLCITEDLEWENITIGNGKTISIWVDDELWKDRGYLMIEKDNCYVDVCEDASVDEFESVIEHCPIVATKMDEYDQSFVEKYVLDYTTNDEVAWLDDAYCALDNETSNNAHWDYLANSIVEEDWECIACYAIYDYNVAGVGKIDDILSSMEKDFKTIEEFGAYLAEKYKDDIQSDIDYYEGNLMEKAIDEFEYQMNIEEW